MTIERIQFLVRGYVSGDLTPEQTEEFNAVLRDGYNALDIQSALVALMEQEPANEYPAHRLEALADSILSSDKVPASKLRRLPVWSRWVAAASVIAIVLFIAIARPFSHKSNRAPIATTTDIPAPQKERAVITLADGSKLYLDSIGTGKVAQQDQVAITRTDEGQIHYQLSNTTGTQGEEAFNTLFNPRGSKVISITLADGTRVWLNSESSLRYPVAFSGNSRKVEVTGEAYFEVAKAQMKNEKGILPGAGQNIPFLVASNGIVTEVLGTHFNVNAYADEPDIKVTLLEGSVKVSNSRGFEIIKPGEQAVTTINNKPQTRNNIDLDDVMAWKNGRFLFKEAAIQTVMKEAARWYDMDVVYQDSIHEAFNGGISRSVNVSQLFSILEATGKVKFEMRGKTVVVKAAR